MTDEIRDTLDRLDEDDIKEYLQDSGYYVGLNLEEFSDEEKLDSIKNRDIVAYLRDMDYYVSEEPSAGVDDEITRLVANDKVTDLGTKTELLELLENFWKAKGISPANWQ